MRLPHVPPRQYKPRYYEEIQEILEVAANYELTFDQAALFVHNQNLIKVQEQFNDIHHSLDHSVSCIGRDM